MYGIMHVYFVSMLQVFLPPATDTSRPLHSGNVIHSSRSDEALLACYGQCYLKHSCGRGCATITLIHSHWDKQQEWKNFQEKTETATAGAKSKIPISTSTSQQASSSNDVMSIIHGMKWRDSLTRLLLTMPSSRADEKLLCDLLSFLGLILHRQTPSSSA